MEIGNVQSLLDLGLTGLLLAAVIVLVNYLREKDKVIAKKDDEKETLQKAVLDVVKENTKSNIELRQASVEARKETANNREAIQTLTGMIHDLLVSHNK